MTYWHNPTGSEKTVVVFDDENVPHKYVFAPDAIVEIPDRFDHGVQRRVGHSVVGHACLVRVDDGPVSPKPTPAAPAPAAAKREVVADEVDPSELEQDVPVVPARPSPRRR